MSLPLSALALVAANLVPLAGVLFFDWSLSAIIVLYWLENGVIGLLNVFKMALASGGVGSGGSVPSLLGHAAKLFMIPFFTFHYGMFWFVHGVFVLGFFGLENMPAFELSPWAMLPTVLNAMTGLETSFPLALLLLLASHTLSFMTNYLGQGEYRSMTLQGQMAQPYGRVVVLHLTILAGGFLVQALGAPVYALVVMVALKTWVDMSAHLREHRTRRVPATLAPAKTA